MPAAVEVEGTDPVAVEEEGQRQGAVDAVGGRDAAELGPARVLLRRHHARGLGGAEGVEAGPAVGVVLGLVDLGDHGVRRNRGLGLTVTQGGHCGIVGAGDGVAGQRGDVGEGLVEGLAPDDEGGHRGDDPVERIVDVTQRIVNVTHGRLRLSCQEPVVPLRSRWADP